MFGRSIRKIDSHFHIRGFNNGKLNELLGVAPEIKLILNLDAVCVAAIPAWDIESLGQNVLCAAYKALYPDSYVYAGLDHYIPGSTHSSTDYLQQVKLFEAIGFDGIKSIEYKPTARKRIGFGLNDSRFDKCFDFLEANHTPILWHVADPEENWFSDKCSEYVKSAGWCYNNSSFISKEALYEETEDVLARHPKLNVVFAHLFFLGADLPRLSKFLDQHPRVSIDVTPGSEMYYHFNKNRDAWREFFITYSERILFGTDNGWGDDSSAAQKVIDGCQKIILLDAYFSTECNVRAWDGTILKGLNLPKDVLQRIFRINFLNMHKGRLPRRLNVNLAADYAKSVWVSVKNNDTLSADKKTQLGEATSLLEQLARPIRS